MINHNSLVQRKRPSMLNTMQRRLPRTLQTLGPKAPNVPMTRTIYSWEGLVKGEFTGGGGDEVINGYLELTNSTGSFKVYDRFTSPVARRRFGITFDVNGREVVVWEEGSTCYVHFYDDSMGEWVNLPLGAGARTPACALDSLLPSKLERDVVVSYIIGNSLYIRYQRERYAIAHKIEGAVIPDGVNLRCVGFTSEWRFAWRFEDTIHQDSYVAPVIVP